MGTISVVFSQVTNVVVGVIDKVSKTSDGFDGLTKVIKGLITIGLTPLKLIFQGIVLTIDQARLAWEESFFGDGDPKTIKELTTRIKETKDEIKEIGEDAVNAGKNVVTNLGKAINEVGQVVQGTIDGVKDISIESAFAQAQANISLENTAKLAEAQQARLVEQFDRQAEKLRQIRDNETNSIEVRQKANDDLLNVLDKQEKAMLAQANAQTASAVANAKMNDTVENRVAVTNALANAEGVLATIEGFRSEQDVNRNALNKEAIELTNSRLEGETELAKNERLFTAERIKNEELKLIATKEALEQNKIDELARLQNVIKSANDGTQAKIDAEKEYALQSQALEQEIILAQEAIDLHRRDSQVKQQQALIDNESLNFDIRRNALIEQERILLEDKALSEEQRNAILKQYSDARLKIDQSETQAKLLLLNAVSDGLSMAASELGESTAAGKAAAVAAATISTYTAIAGQLQAFSKIPIPGYAIAQAIVTGATGLLQVKKILAVKTPKGGSSGSAPSISTAMRSAGADSPSVSAPMFNVVGTSGQNQIAQTLGQQPPVQAYVVSGNVSTAQSLDRNIISNASI
jgi:hypothetical protein